jgi:hypothetical protein
VSGAVIVTDGAPESMIQVWLAGVASALPAWSIALTSKV